jgi:hypothetical protein
MKTTFLVMQGIPSVRCLRGVSIAEDRWRRLSRVLEGLRKERDLESRAKDIMRLDEQVAEAEKQRWPRARAAKTAAKPTMTSASCGCS